MNPWLTAFLALVAGGAVTAAILLRGCSPHNAPDGFALAVDPSSIESFKYSVGGEEIELKRRGARWRVSVGERADNADPGVPNSILALAAAVPYHDRLPASEIDGSDEQGDYGVRTPNRWLSLSGSRGTTRLLFGKEAALEGRIYARIDGHGDIYVIDDEILRLLPSDPNTLRSRMLSETDPEDVERVIIREAAGEIELARGPSGWRLTKPLSAPADSEVVEQAVGKLLQTRIDGFVADDSGDLGLYGIGEGVFEVAIHAEGRTRPQVIRFGLLPEQHPGTVNAQITARDSVVRLPESAREILTARPEDFRDRRLLPLNLDTVDLLRIRAAGADPIELVRDGEGWKFATGGPASTSAVESLVHLLADTRVEGFSRDPLDTADLEVEFLAVLSENTPEVPAGTYPIAAVRFALGEGPARAAVDGIPGSALVPSDVLEKIPTEKAAWRLPVAP